LPGLRIAPAFYRKILGEKFLGGNMIRRIIAGLLLYIEGLIHRWAERREVEATREKQKANDERDRGSADDIAQRMRDRAGRERDTGGSLPDADDPDTTDASSRRD
jgi:hypothetical protein